MTNRFGTHIHPLSRLIPILKCGSIQLGSIGWLPTPTNRVAPSQASWRISRATSLGILTTALLGGVFCAATAFASDSHTPASPMTGDSPSFVPSFVPDFLPDLVPDFVNPTASKLSLPSLNRSPLHLSQASPGQAAPASRGQVNPTPVRDRLPEALAEAVRREGARQLKRSPQSLRIANFSREMWPDACLGLKRNDVCAAVVTPGWRMELTDGSQSWFYRTDDGGLAIRPERFTSMGSLPKQIQDQVLAAAARQTGMAIAQLTVSTSRPQLWDSCLGVASPNETCNPVEIPGWQVIVSNPRQYWVFHTDQKGAQIRFNAVTSGRGNAIPNFLSEENNWPPINENTAIVFQSIQTGGIAGKTYQLVLQGDGQLLRINIIGNSYTPAKRIAILSPQQVRQFRQLLAQQEFTDFKEFRYPPIPGAADYFTILLQSQQTKIQYSDIQQSQLPTALQRVVQAWNTLTSMR